MTDSIEAAEAALARGDLLAAFDCVSAAQAAGRSEPRLAYLLVLILARMGETRRALASYENSVLAEADDADSRALRGRLLKDLALAADPASRLPLFHEAAEAYADAFARTGDYFPAINAASLALLAGDRQTARRRAEAVLAMPSIAAAGDYFSMATRAEACILIERWDDARTAIAEALRLPGADGGARSSTLRQFRLLAAHSGLDDADTERLIGSLRPPPTMVYAGHMFAGGDAGEAALAGEIAAALDTPGIAIGYGALACGADIMIAEALLARGGELNVVLPFAHDDFLRFSVEPGGARWIERFKACLARATSCFYASEAGFVGDDHQFNYGSRMAMGLARLRADHLGGEALQLVVWDGASNAGQAGTGADVAVWRALGGKTRIVVPTQIDRMCDRSAADTAPGATRELRAIIFSDFVGFSQLDEAMLPRFWHEVLGKAGAVLARHGDAILASNSWGDALFAVTADVATAAEVVLDLQGELGKIDAPELGVGPGAGMRFGVHYGPVYVARDPITGRDNIFGTEVTRTARIEPVTPTGEVYVTRPFAAMLAMDAPDRFDTAYVGTVALAKNYGAFQMYRLTRAGSCGTRHTECDGTTE